jgi:hypothetical protein
MRMGLLDVLLNNTDRHAGNWMIDPDNNIAAIDHGLAFKNDDVERSSARNSPFVGLFVDTWTGEYLDTNPLTRLDVEQIRGDLEKIRPRFEQLGRGDWFGQVELRLERLAARATGYRPLLEDAPTMFAAARMARCRGVSRVVVPLVPRPGRADRPTPQARPEPSGGCWRASPPCATSASTERPGVAGASACANRWSAGSHQQEAASPPGPDSESARASARPRPTRSA